MKIDEVRHLTIDQRLLRRAPGEMYLGRQRYVAYSEELDAILAEAFGRSGLCLKVSREPQLVTARQLQVWEREMAIQNLFANRSIAPRVMALVILNNAVIALVTEYIPHTGRSHIMRVRAELIPKIKALMEEFGLGNKKGQVEFDEQTWNFQGSKFVDFNGFMVRDQDKFHAALNYQDLEGKRE